MVMFLSSSKQKPDNEVTQIGALLRRSREARSENLGDIAAELLIDPTILNALEEGRVKDLPGWARVIGALRSYAGYLELDATPLVVRYRKILAEPAGYAASPARQPAAAPRHSPTPPAPSVTGDENPASPPAPSRNRTPRGLIFFITVFIALAVMAGVYLSSSPAPLTDVQPVSARLKAMLDRTIGAADENAPAKEQAGTAEIRTETKPLPGLEAPSETSGGKTTTISRTDTNTPPQDNTLADIAGNSVNIKPVDRLTRSRAAAGRLTLRATAPVWVSITTANGASIMTSEMKPGDMFLVPDESGLVMEVRDAGAVEYFIDGTLIGRLGKPGEALSGLELDKTIRQKTGG